MRRRAFSLIELLCVLILLGAFGVIATRLFTATFKLSQASAEGQNATASLDTALAALRADVWSAQKIDVQGATTLVIDKQIIWIIANDQIARNGQQKWPAPPDASFESTDAGLLFRVKNSEPVTLVNEPAVIAKVMP